MQQLEEMGTAQNRKVYARHGVGEEMFGVSFANQNKLAKAIKRDQALALELWATANHDARILATMVADPAQADDPLLNSWGGRPGQLRHYRRLFQLCRKNRPGPAQG